MEDITAFIEETKKSGAWVFNGGLHPPGTATVVRVRGDEALTTDGPFAETKEVLGGFFILDCESLDEALAYAEKIPAAEHGAVEVRPIAQVPARV